MCLYYLSKYSIWFIYHFNYIHDIFTPYVPFITMLLVILSSNVLNQSIHSQESDDNVSDESSSNNNDLLVSMKPLEHSVGDGDEEKFVVSVTDSDSQPISDDVKIYGSIMYPDGTHKHTFQGITDENGHYVFPLTIDNKISLGELETQVNVTKLNYKLGSLSNAFSVV